MKEAEIPGGIVKPRSSYLSRVYGGRARRRGSWRFQDLTGGALEASRLQISVALPGDLESGGLRFAVS